MPTFFFFLSVLFVRIKTGMRLWLVMTLFIDTPRAQASCHYQPESWQIHLIWAPRNLSQSRIIYTGGNNTANNFVVGPTIFKTFLSCPDSIACRGYNEHNEWPIKSIRQLCSQMRRKVDGRTGVRKWSILTTICRARNRGQQCIWTHFNPVTSNWSQAF